MSEVFTPMAGMVSDTGSATCVSPDSPPGACAVWLGTGVNFGAATVDGLAGRCVSGACPWLRVRPVTPAPTASKPAVSAAAESNRLRGRFTGSPGCLGPGAPGPAQAGPAGQREQRAPGQGQQPRQGVGRPGRGAAKPGGRPARGRDLAAGRVGQVVDL